jgi:hypothetical protein
MYALHTQDSSTILNFLAVYLIFKKFFCVFFSYYEKIAACRPDQKAAGSALMPKLEFKSQNNYSLLQLMQRCSIPNAFLYLSEVCKTGSICMLPKDPQKTSSLTNTEPVF